MTTMTAATYDQGRAIAATQSVNRLMSGLAVIDATADGGDLNRKNRMVASWIESVLIEKLDCEAEYNAYAETGDFAQLNEDHDAGFRTLIPFFERVIAAKRAR